MNNRLIIALVVLVGLGAAVILTVRSRESSTTVAAPDVKLPKVKKEDIVALEIAKPDKTTISLAKKDKDWALTAPVEAKADQSAVDAALDKLSDLEVASIAATRKENHKLLQVDAESGIHVKAKGGGDKPLLDLWIGESKTGGTMVRMEGSDTVVAVRGSVRYAFDKEVKMFRDRVVTDLDPKDLASVSIESPKGSFKFEKADDKWKQTLGKGQKPIERFSESKVSSLVSSVARLRASDFGDPKESPEALGFDKPSSKVTLTPKSGEPIVLELGREKPGSGDYYLHVLGNPVVYRISKYTAERMTPEVKAFEEEEKKAGDATPAPSPMAGAGGENQIPPDVMRQLQQQMQMQGGHP
jgi:hypothetical protein